MLFHGHIRALKIFRDLKYSNERFHTYYHESIHISDAKLQVYQDATANDPTLQLVAKYLKDGWPEKRKLEPCVKPFYTVCNDITYVQGLVLKGAR